MEAASDPPGDRAYVYAVTDEEAYLEAGEDEKPAMDGGPPDLVSIICQFCGKSTEQVPMLFAAPRPVRDPTTFATIAVVWICNECVGRLAEALAQQPRGLDSSASVEATSGRQVCEPRHRVKRWVGRGVGEHGSAGRSTFSSLAASGT